MNAKRELDKRIAAKRREKKYEETIERLETEREELLKGYRMNHKKKLKSGSK